MTSFRNKLPHGAMIACLALASTLMMPKTSFRQNQNSTPTNTSPDNSARNDAHNKTADQQSNATSDRMLTKQIRQALIADKSLSMYGHNVKIIAQHGMAALKGPVHSEEERKTINSKAIEVAGSADKVNNQPYSQTVAPAPLIERLQKEIDMAGKNTAAFGIYPNRAAAESAVDQLTAGGFSHQDVSVLMSDNKGSKDFATEKTPRPRKALQPVSALAEP